MKFSSTLLGILIGCSVLLPTGQADSASLSRLDQKISGRETTFYREFFDQVVYYPLARLLRWDQYITRHVGMEALDVNVFDEVPDSAFFENRLGKQSMSISEIAKGPGGTPPETKGPWVVTKGKDDGYTVGFFIKDAKGDKYLLKFDPADHPEMATSAEIIAHKFFYAFGYHVPSYAIVYFKPDILEAGPNATYYNGNGFKKKLDNSAIQELLQKAPVTKNGRYRAVASRILDGIPKGYMSLEGRRSSDPDDLIPHEDRREIRALEVIGAWTNQYDLRSGNTLDMLIDENGKAYLKHYIIDFGSSFGSAGYRAKHPSAAHETVIDFGAIARAFVELKVEDKVWEDRWDQNGRTIAYQSLGYFDNIHFNPAAWRSQLDQEAFLRLTEADGYWASKIIARFSDEMIRAVVKTGEITNQEAESFLIDTLIERRDMIVRYWFSKAVPLESIQVKPVNTTTYSLNFEDLAVAHGIDSPMSVKYRWRTKRGSWQEYQASPASLQLDTDRLKETVFIERWSSASQKWSSLPLRLKLSRSASQEPFHLSGINRGHD
ncbi:MAG: hypothetical protein COV74_08195 [Candidatus Omnitrophica bacterium CG11_big_fil_rev_8_21_14_0_20_45_26]|uniref:Uncharacterized protein n=1 Tax=Candidatus Abzuiibacterium crystallinum TaxID=1974748 RepID=A0A2H0LM08_9BACT|nr:MAG: hypothetical protein COV74_08195 [Candidatus Omnitrophica bacterium CG11_big_fil_rev_8_21_14_0_20_45_26]PIW63641.1 MAG: hypothetical protein COW12_09080 [Candidatus Omnitrophica bacterium CG12_big_fil_rev_8_21_14_0_65_45_16]